MAIGSKVTVREYMADGRLGWLPRRILAKVLEVSTVEALHVSTIMN